MATITAALVKDLREKTGAGMMDCKTALTETNGDIEAAVDWLRKKGLAKAAKKSGRVAAEGLVGVAVEANLGVVVEVNSETDFVARNDDFQALVRGVVAVALDKAPDVDAEAVQGRALSRRRHGRRGDRQRDRHDRREHHAAPRRRGCMSRTASIGHYVHSADRRRPRPHRRHRRAGIEGRGGRAAALGRQVAMHVAAASPLALDACRPRPGDGRAREGGAGARRTPASPPHVLEKIVEFGPQDLSTRRSACSIRPSSTTPPRPSPRRSRKPRRAVGAPIAVKGFVRYALGEGVEKPAEEA